MESPSTNNRISWLHFIRATELECALGATSLPRGAKVLEFGSGDGFVARLLAEKGFKVVAVDVDPREPQQYPVIRIGEHCLPFGPDSFDLVFSSNTLEHVKDRGATLKGIRRVLKPGGAAIFTLPTVAWRLYTLLNIPLRLALGSKLKANPLYYESEGEGMEARQRGDDARAPRSPLPARAFRYLMQPHGEFPSALHELVAYSPRAWKRLFRQNGFRVAAVVPLPILYTGGFLFPWRWLGWRKRLANRYTASCLAYQVTGEG